MTAPLAAVDVIATEQPPRPLPRALEYVPVAIATVGAAAAVFALLRPWQTTVIISPQNGQEVEHLRSTLSSTGSIGTSFLVTLIALVTAAVLSLFAAPAVRRTARLAGLALAGTALVIGGSLVYELLHGSAGTPLFSMFGVLPDTVRSEVQVAAWIGLAAPALIGLAVLLASPVEALGEERATYLDDDDDDEPAYGEGIEVVDLTVKAG